MLSSGLFWNGEVERTLRVNDVASSTLQKQRQSCCLRAPFPCCDLSLAGPRKCPSVDVFSQVWIEFGRIKLAQGYHPNDVEEEWGKLIIEMLEREKLLRPAVERSVPAGPSLPPGLEECPKAPLSFSFPLPSQAGTAATNR